MNFFSLVVLQTHIGIRGTCVMLVLIWKLFQKKTAEKQKKPKKPIQQNKEPTVYKSPPQSIYKKKNAGFGLR